MANYVLPDLHEPAPLKDNEAILIASGDLRLSANQTCWAGTGRYGKAHRQSLQ